MTRQGATRRRQPRRRTRSTRERRADPFKNVVARLIADIKYIAEHSSYAHSVLNELDFVVSHEKMRMYVSDLAAQESSARGIKGLEMGDT